MSTMVADRLVLGTRRTTQVQPDRRLDSVPWTPATMGVVAGLHAVAVGLVLTAWFGASTRALATEQIAWLNLGLVGLMVSGTGNTVWLLVARRSVAGRIRAVHRVCVAVVQDAAPGGAAPVSTAPDPELPVTLVTAPGLTRVHLSSCPLVRGRDVAAPDRELEPCGVCRP